MAVSVTVLGTVPQEAKEDGETDKLIFVELTDATRVIPEVLGLQVKESPRLPLLVELAAVKRIVTGSAAHVTFG
jgi:hypothetical protein